MVEIGGIATRNCIREARKIDRMKEMDAVHVSEQVLYAKFTFRKAILVCG